MHICFIICHIAQACLWLELLLHFLTDLFQTWHVSSVQSVCVRDILFVNIMFFLTELSALEKCLIFNVAHACLWSELLLHFLPDWFQTWHVSSLRRVDVRDIFFKTIIPC